MIKGGGGLCKDNANRQKEKEKEGDGGREG